MSEPVRTIKGENGEVFYSNQKYLKNTNTGEILAAPKARLPIGKSGEDHPIYHKPHIIPYDPFAAHDAAEKAAAEAKAPPAPDAPEGEHKEPEKETPPAPPALTAEQRMDKLVEAIEGLTEEDYTKEDPPRPKVEPIERLAEVGEISGEDRDTAWGLFQERNPG